ncbi:MAG: hypothetical protein BM557_03510 [Flavobacterium sp. MedPE-SWcel]|uniref:carboxypeptidase-like regulatory domain-containing protein n=1 Tax=uncultured Flavobacterium sp. TaxID=165435 RepID=UPI0009192C9B|nr:carboxypeptidase-like regulatory domain-containing protein [uncultured Flavobacterium sp.]OIQ21331.1 MAG: hypothetical protein BM557_03510 [Flavobacterium sp. MedPE-SWcel]
MANRILLFLLLLTGSILNAQSSKKDQIADKINDYFFLERESIHAHFDKDVFLIDESIWFKGYTYHRKSSNPFYACVNIFATLIDDKGNIIEKQLLYGDMGVFSGSFKLDDSMRSGKYYIQFYTNWMNNFTEDESFVKEVTIINQNISPSLFNTPNYSKVNIKLNPEGGTLISGVNNSIAIDITDYNGVPIHTAAITLVNSSTGKTHKTISVNKHGYGKFNFTPIPREQYKIIATINEKKYEQNIDLPQYNGVALEVNNYTIPNKTIIKARINKLTQESLSNQPLFLVVHKDNESIITEINFPKEDLEQTISFENTSLFDGLNTIRIINNELEELAERVIYNYPESDLKLEVSKGTEKNGIITLNGKINSGTTNLSIAMLPASTITLKEHNDIYSSLLIKPYLEGHKEINVQKYINTVSRRNQYEIDLFLLNQKSKYKWRNIKNISPKSKYTFDIGLSLKGTINRRNLKKYKVKVSSLKGKISEVIAINEKNEFYLNNLILSDSSNLDFYLVKGEATKSIKLYPQIFNRNRIYNKQYKPKTYIAAKSDSITNIFPEIPNLVDTNAILLDEVELNGTTTKLKYERAFGNSQLRGYKISENDEKSFFYVLDLIRYHGFDVENNGASVGIYGRTINTINGQRTTPMIYIDNIRVMSFDILQGMQTADIDEFYINQHASVPSVDNRMGIVRIYMKKNYMYKSKINSPTSFLVENGFKKITPFKNAEYFTTSSKGFENFGIINWEPRITTDDNGKFQIELPRTGQKSVIILIEGFSNDGKLISETKTINLN